MWQLHSQRVGVDALTRSFEFGDNSTALYQLAVIVDPLSEAAQKWAPLLAVRAKLVALLC